MARNHQMRASEIADLVAGRLIGPDDTIVTGVATLDRATESDISFFSDARYIAQVAQTRARLLVVGPDEVDIREDCSMIVVDDPHAAFMKIVREFRPTPEAPVPGTDPSAVVDADSRIDPTATIGPFCVISAGSQIGSGVILSAGVYIAPGVTVGDKSEIGQSSVILERTVIGRRCRIGACTVVGGRGFGFRRDGEGVWHDVPQTGGVSIGDDVEIGAGVTIDRGTIDDTEIGSGVKLDNQIHVAHNVRIGENTIIAAQTGISGSTQIGPRNMIAGQVGIVGHIETVEGVIVEPQSGVSKSLVRPGRYFGHPAKDHAIALRQEGAIRQLPELLKEFRSLRREIEELRCRLDEQSVEVEGATEE